MTVPDVAVHHEDARCAFCPTLIPALVAHVVVAEDVTTTVRACLDCAARIELGMSPHHHENGAQ